MNFLSRAKEIFKDFVYFFLNFLPGKSGAAVLMYHSIANNGVFFTVKPKEFEKQMAYLKEKNYRVLKVADLVEMLENKKELPRKAVVLTFDDGYEDNYENAFPILKKYGFPATIFLATGHIGQEMNNSQNVPLKTLNWAEIEEMHRSGLIDFEPHSHTHRRLDRISSEELKEEIKKPREIIETRLNKECHFSAYPFGKYNQVVSEEFKQQGFKAVFTVRAGLIKTGDQAMELNRISINSRISFVRFRAKLKGLIWLRPYR